MVRIRDHLLHLSSSPIYLTKKIQQYQNVRGPKYFLPVDQIHPKTSETSCKDIPTKIRDRSPILFSCHEAGGAVINTSALPWSIDQSKSIARPLKTSYPHIRSAATVYLLRSISSKDLHLAAFGCAEDQFRGQISNQQLPYSKTNKST